jgi:hypothetical protein
MKAKSLLIALLGSTVGINSCTKNATELHQDLFTVEGTVTNALGPVNAARVSLDNALNWTAVTSATGYFKITNVTEGEHALTVQFNSGNGSFVEKNEKIAVFSDVTLNALLLPSPPQLYQPQNMTSSSMLINWQPTDSEDFYEYKLFRRDNPGLDENTGELIYVSTAKQDTSFVDTGLFANKKYYYRVYLMNNFGRLGGSNIVNGTTTVGNLIPAGEFDNLVRFNDYWTYSPINTVSSVSLDDSIKVNGNASLHVKSEWRSNGFGTTLQLKSPIRLAPNITHELTFWIKVKGIRGNTDDLFLNIYQGSQWVKTIYVAEGGYGNREVDSDWNQKTGYLTVTNDTPISISLHCNNENIWLDDLSLVPIQ